MKRKAPKKTTTHRHSYEMVAYHDDDSPNWSIVFTWAQDGVRMVTITSADADLTTAMQRAHQAMVTAQTGIREEQLILPDMGDFQVFYHAGFDN